jgi:glycine/D-amino acid oxidase-like deaminating enzyme
MNRRRCLEMLLGAASLLPSCARRFGRPVGALAQGAFPAVHVAVDEVLRSAAGLVPFRPSGYVVRAEKVGHKLLVHHYGHGGAGVTLSWGTAEIAVREAARSLHRRAAVLGCGAVGLATARLLQRDGFEVTIYTRALPQETTSSVAGALWFPVGVFQKDRATPAFQAGFAKAARIAHGHFRTLGERYGVRRLPTFFLSRELFPETGMLDRRSAISDLLPRLRDLRRDEHPFPYAHVRAFDAMLIETPIYLPAVLRDFHEAQGRLVVRELRGPEEVLALPEPVVLNCTGLGARAFCLDAQLEAVKGQVAVLRPQPRIQYGTVLEDDLFMFPRRDGIVLGGRSARGLTTPEVDLDERDRILGAHVRLFGQPRRRRR